MTAGTERSASSPSWTSRLRDRTIGALPPDQALPDRQPAYVASWIYVFGVATLAALLVVVATGLVLAMAGPQWWHVSTPRKRCSTSHVEQSGHWKRWPQVRHSVKGA